MAEPTFTLTASSIKKLRSKLDSVTPRRDGGDDAYGPDDDGWIAIVVTDKATLTGNRFKYAWHMLSLAGTNFETVTDPDNGYSGTTTDNFAICAQEIQNASGTPVTNGVYFGRFYQTSDDKVIMVFTAGGGATSTITGLVAGNAAGKAKYIGKSFTDVTADVSASGDLAQADLGTLSAEDDCLILNPPELGSSSTGHDVTATLNTSQFSLYFTGRLAYINSDGTKIVHAQLFWVGCASA